MNFSFDHQVQATFVVWLDFVDNFCDSRLTSENLYIHWKDGIAFDSASSQPALTCKEGGRTYSFEQVGWKEAGR